MTRICVVGAGAIGGFLGTRLAAAGYQTSALARGATLTALRTHGWRLLEMPPADSPGPAEAGSGRATGAGGLLSAPVRVSADPAELGEQDIVIIAVKGPALAEVAGRIGPLLGPGTVVVTAMNGVPWWFFDGFGGKYEGLRLGSVDPGGVIEAALPTERIIGCVVHVACSVVEPGLVRHGAGNELILGDAIATATTTQDAAGTERVEGLAEMLRRAGVAVTVSGAIRQDIWYKLWGNMTMNPVSVLTGATSDLMLDDELVRGFCNTVMTEAAAIGAKIGCPIGQPPEERNAVTRRLGAMRTSMLQDAAAGRPLELDALLTVVREIGAAVGEPTPCIDALLGLTRLHARVRGLYPW